MGKRAQNPWAAATVAFRTGPLFAVPIDLILYNNQTLDLPTLVLFMVMSQGFARSVYAFMMHGSMDFIRALVQQWRLPYRIGYIAMAAYRFVPMLSSELHVIQNAHKVRGISNRGGLRAQYDRAKRYAVPLLATVIPQGGTHRTGDGQPRVWRVWDAHLLPKVTFHAARLGVCPPCSGS